MPSDSDDADDEYGYAKASVEDVSTVPNPTRVKKELDEALGVSEFGLNYYEADPGEDVPWGYHRHPEHEEVFLVLDGELTVETADGDYVVGTGEAFFVPADAPNKATVTGDVPARFVAVGAPKESDWAVISEECPNCGEETDRESEVDGDEYVLYCAECGAEVDRLLR
ncbi:cupin domain-containing protein [Halobaculum sp. P14]|uniref:cupin domain-containing protein n=1 Tax=Halobaculum sp. P14 TaxID=3421638 RepID=UPI003EB79173